ncbi:MAG TPA: RsmG family class I SAM-dependent methyltransferase [Thermoanaerobaculia bacterium]|nr:RsmG family class I SAM-dependent methyltransferase [Thermoanaerobaculia bacterium]
MAVLLPALDRDELRHRLGSAGCPPFSDAALDRLHAHHRELVRWSPRLSLIGPGTAGETVERHYAESLAGAPLVGPGRLLDVGSGAGFPGLVLAAALPEVGVILVERRARKAAFLRAAARRMGVSVEVVEGDLASELPRARVEGVDSVTLRAVRLDDRAWRTVLGCASPGARVLIWCGRNRPTLPDSLRFEGAVPLAGAHRRILRYRYQP